MKIQTVKIKTLKHPEKNARRHPELQIKEFAKTLEMFGQTRPAVIDEDNTILAGNGMVMAMLEAGIEDVWVYKITGLSDKEKKKLMLSDNRIFSLGADDTDAQMGILQDIIGEDLDFEVPGFDADILKSLIATTDEIDDTLGKYGSDVAPEVKEPPDIPGLADQTGADPGGAQGPANHPVEPEKTKTEKHVRCPHCGEVIWVG